MEHVLIVDDHASVRRGVGTLLQELGWTVVCEASTINQARSMFRLTNWTVAVLDLQLPDGDGLELLQEVRNFGTKKPILVHSLMPDSVMASRALKAGANGFINKGSDPDEFKRAALKVASGGRYVSPEYAEELALSLAEGGSPTPHEKLSEREFQVMCMLAAGKTPTQCAEALDCSVNSISTYRARILKKLGLKTSLEIVRYALSRKLVNL